MFANMEDSELDSVTEEDIGARSDTESQETRHPWPYLKELFEVVGSKNDSLRMQCVLCLPRKHELLAFKISPSNLKKHIQVCYFSYAKYIICLSTVI